MPTDAAIVSSVKPRICHRKAFSVKARKFSGGYTPHSEYLSQISAHDNHCRDLFTIVENFQPSSATNKESSSILLRKLLYRVSAEMNQNIPHEFQANCGQKLGMKLFDF
jgi:hypothetical protein